MKTPVKIVIVAAVVGLAAAAIVARLCDPTAAPAAVAGAGPHSGVPLPRLLDLGSGKCIPCRMMAPILDHLEREYAGRMAVEFIDIHKEEGAAGKYGVNVIPTQIFYGADGKELWRHEGFLSREDILAKWKELGVEFGGETRP
jgi:thioredoxin 1